MTITAQWLPNASDKNILHLEYAMDDKSDPVVTDSINYLVNNVVKLISSVDSDKIEDGKKTDRLEAG